MYLLNSLRAGEKRVPSDIGVWLTPTKVTKSSWDPLITWIGHSTFLIQINKKNILTDPIFGSPSIFFPRILPPGISPQKLPKIDYVVISHNHFDHMDSKSLLFLKEVNPEIVILAPEGNQHWFHKRNFKHVHCLNWWRKESFEQINFTFLPAFHWSQRGLFDRNKSLWGSWMIEIEDFSIYFAGDTAYSHHFKAIGKEFKRINVALMPIGPCEPRKYMFDTHVNAEEAGEAFLDLGAQQFIPMHWGAFHFGVDAFETPIKRIQRWRKRNRAELKNKSLYIPTLGAPIQFHNSENFKTKSPTKQIQI